MVDRPHSPLADRLHGIALGSRYRLNVRLVAVAPVGAVRVLVVHKEQCLRTPLSFSGTTGNGANRGICGHELYSCERMEAISSSARHGSAVIYGPLEDAAPRHDNSNWKEAARQIESLNLFTAAPVIYPSPFIEAKSPVWKPDYPLPGFLYCHLLVYPVGGKPYPFPFERSSEADAYAAELAWSTLPSAGRFLIYGGDRNVWAWQNWFSNATSLRVAEQALETVRRCQDSGL
jgi:hypothetical protein